MNTQIEEKKEMALSVITDYNVTEKALALARDKYLNLTFDLGTKEGMEVARVSRRELVTLRTSLEAKRKELKAPALEHTRLIDAEAKRITAEIEALEAPIDAKITAFEAAEKAKKAEREAKEAARVAAIEARIEAIRVAPMNAAGSSSAHIEQTLAGAKAFIVDESFGELRIKAEAVHAVALEQLTNLLADKLAQEAEAARLKAEREALDAKAKADQEQARLDFAEAERKIAAERAEFKRVQDEHAASVRKQQEVFEAQQAEIEKIRRQEEAEAKAKREVEEEQIRIERAAEANRIMAQVRVQQALRDAEEARQAVERANLAAEKEKLERQERQDAFLTILEVCSYDLTPAKKITQIEIICKRALAKESEAA